MDVYKIILHSVGYGGLISVKLDHRSLGSLNDFDELWYAFTVMVFQQPLGYGKFYFVVVAPENIRLLVEHQKMTCLWVMEIVTCRLDGFILTMVSSIRHRKNVELIMRLILGYGNGGAIRHR